MSWATQVHCFDELDSTMVQARKFAARGAPEGTTVVAKRQRSGRGRHGRGWFSPAGGLWMTTLLRPPKHAAVHTLALVAGLSTGRTLVALGARDVGLKWPNDVLCRASGRKLAGILLEVDFDSPHASTVLVGIGVNLAARHTQPVPADAAKDIAARYIGLSDLVPGPALSPAAVLPPLLSTLTTLYGAWTAQGPAPLCAAWSELDMLRGHRVEAENAAGKVAGVAAGLADDGCLQIRTADGIERIHSGEVTLRVDWQVAL